MQYCVLVLTLLGSFWQLTDIHYDSMYDDPALRPFICRSTDGLRNSSSGRTPGGKYGDYNCDAPWALAISAIKAMKNIEPHPDFILWTGDSVPHVPDSDLNQTEVLQLIHNITSYLSATFPEVPVYPALGNHDVWPANQYPEQSDKYYLDVLERTGWRNLLPTSAVNSFQKGGFYTVQLKSGLRLVVLNSNVWYFQDHKMANHSDPVGQFTWLEYVLQDAEKQHTSVLLVGHVPPGMFGRSRNTAWLRPEFNKKLIQLLQQYHSVIVAAIFGHEHTDAFRVLYDQGNAFIPMFMAPAVTPWFSTLPGVGSNNPGIRLYNYSRHSLSVVDYMQFFLNLTAANSVGTDSWTVEYCATSSYGIPDVSPSSLNVLIERFVNGSLSPDLFHRYFRYNSVSRDLSECAGECKKQQICAAAEVDFDEYSQCMESVEWRRHHHHHHRELSSTPAATKPHSHGRHRIRPFSYFLLGSLILVTAVLFLVLAVCCCQRRHAVVFFSRSHYSLIQDT